VTSELERVTATRSRWQRLWSASKRSTATGSRRPAFREAAEGVVVGVRLVQISRTGLELRPARRVSRRPGPVDLGVAEFMSAFVGDPGLREIG
jgi:hypothetical protein